MYTTTHHIKWFRLDETDIINLNELVQVFCRDNILHYEFRNGNTHYHAFKSCEEAAGIYAEIIEAMEM